ncbi:MAG: 4-hydroxy-tetrahydrodipicolinate reductase [Planctomycetota bacterium]|nr:4-hydroxy-tetrahydrodipicolinate reductase [Planctomycetota bacterium]
MGVRIAVSGAAGRMGRRVIEMAMADPDIRLVAAIESPGHPWVGRHLTDVAHVAGSEVCVADRLSPEDRVQVIIDFSTPEGAVERARDAANLGAALVTGTTGLSEGQADEIGEISGRVPVLRAANFSIGVNMLLKLVKGAAEALGEAFEVEIVEAHHHGKADAPSGTALAIAEAIAGARGRPLEKDAVYGRRGRTGPRRPSEIGIHAVRMGDVVGEHTVYFAAPGERLVIGHIATSRDAFASGALRAAKWIAGRPAGMYTMSDMLRG